MQCQCQKQQSFKKETLISSLNWPFLIVYQLFVSGLVIMIKSQACRFATEPWTSFLCTRICILPHLYIPPEPVSQEDKSKCKCSNYNTEALLVKSLLSAIRLWSATHSWELCFPNWIQLLIAYYMHESAFSICLHVCWEDCGKRLILCTYSQIFSLFIVRILTFQANFWFI